MSSPSPESIFREKFSQLALLYSEVKSYVLIAEELYDKFPVALVNELRNSYDHVFRIFNNNRSDNVVEIEKQFVNASRHLKRCGYDALEFLINAYLQKCHEFLLPYPKRVLVSVMQNQYYDIKNFMLNSDTRLAKSREEKNSKIVGYFDAQGNEVDTEDLLQVQYKEEIPGSEYDTFYPEFKDLLEDVKNNYDAIISRISDLDELDLELKDADRQADIKSKRFNIWLSLITLAIGFLISLVLFYFEVFHFGSNDFDLKTIDTNEIKSDTTANPN